MAGSGDHDLSCLTIKELEHHAYNLMDKQTRDYYNEGADSGSTLLENMEAYAKYRIRPRVLRDVSNIDTSVNIFGHRNSVPFGVAPTAMQCLAHSDGELGTARACKNKGVAMGLSSFATKTLEEVASECDGAIPNVLQLYLFEEKDHSRRLIQRAKKAGFKAVFLTVDTPFLGRRNLEIRNQFKLPPHFKVANFVEEEEPALRDDGNGEQAAKPQTKRQASEAGYHDGEKRVAPKGPITFHTHAANPTLSWDRDIEWLKQQCHPEMEVWVKGVATAEDAILAMHHGVNGIVVSNHGGRQLNGALATLDALPEVAEAVQGKIPVHVDGGIRHGTDVFKALALGADFCWVGRPALWGLAYKGQAGVELMLKLLGDEVRLCMGLAGCVKVQDISKEYLVKVRERDLTRSKF
jgi:(S)-2-hydroxy-acid oxidase